MQPRRQFNTSVDAGRRAAPGRTGRLRVRSLAARSLMVVLLAALGMLLGMPQQAEAQTATALWSGTLTVKAMSGDFGCSNSITNNHCSDHLTDDDFRYDSTDYAITGIVVRSSGELEIEFDTTLTTATLALTLNVGSTAFNFVDADTMGTESLIWNNSGLSWSAGDTVTLTLMTPPIEVDIKTFAVFIEDNQGGLDIRLKSEPGADVTVNLESSDTGIFTVSRASFTFTPMNWDVEQGPDIIPVQDADALDEMGTLTVSGADFDDILVEVVIVDDDLLLTLPQSPVALNEEETTTFEVALASEPVWDREVYVQSHDTGAVTANPRFLDFTSTNWDEPQEVTVTGVADDDPKDEQVTITVEVTGVTAGTVTVDVTDDDEPGVTIVPTTLDVVEGGTATYTVKLDTIPTADVAVAITSSDTGKATVLPETLTFTTVNWQTAQTVTVTGVEDADTTNDAVTLTHSATSTDTDYQGIMIAGVTVTVNDNDTAQVTGVMIEPGNAQLVVEWTAVANATGYEVQWKSGGQSYNTGTRQATITSGSTTSHTISSLNNGTEYTVRMRATRTGANNGAYSAEVLETPVTAAGVTVSVSALTVTEEDTTGGSYTVVLDSQPTESVTVMVAGHAGTDVTANPATLTFTTTDWGHGPDGHGDGGQRCGHSERYGHADPQRDEHRRRLQRHLDRRRDGDRGRQRQQSPADHRRWRWRWWWRWLRARAHRAQVRRRLPHIASALRDRAGRRRRGRPRDRDAPERLRGHLFPEWDRRRPLHRRRGDGPDPARQGDNAGVGADLHGQHDGHGQRGHGRHHHRGHCGGGGAIPPLRPEQERDHREERGPGGGWRLLLGRH